jgi:hypothetical protein
MKFSAREFSLNELEQGKNYERRSYRIGGADGGWQSAEGDFARHATG